MRTFYRFEIIAASLFVILTGAIAGCVIVTAPPQAGQPPTISKSDAVKPEIRFFDVEPKEIGMGELATLKWDVSGVQNISIDQGVGEAAHAGDRKVSPKTTTIYTLTATNSAGSVSASVTVSVVGNVNAVKIALTRDDVRLYGFTYASSSQLQNEEAMSTYQVTFVKGKESLINSVYVYPPGGGAERHYYTIESQYRTNNQTLYSIGEVRAYLIVDKSGIPDEPETFAIRFVKNNVFVHLGFVSNYQALESLARLLVSRIY
jgi:hypothetical protein